MTDRDKDKERIFKPARLQKAMELKGWTQKELSDESGVPASSIHDYLRIGQEVTTKRKPAYPKEISIQKMADALGVDPAWLTGMDVPMNGEGKKIPFDAFIMNKELSIIQIELEKQMEPFKKMEELVSKHIIEFEKLTGSPANEMIKPILKSQKEMEEIWHEIQKIRKPLKDFEKELNAIYSLSNDGRKELMQFAEYLKLKQEKEDK